MLLFGRFLLVVKQAGKEGFGGCFAGPHGVWRIFWRLGDGRTGFNTGKPSFYEKSILEAVQSHLDTEGGIVCTMHMLKNLIFSW